MRSSGSTITLEFKSDTVIGGKGFLIEWMAVQGSGPSPTIEPGQFPKGSASQILLRCLVSFHNWSQIFVFSGACGGTLMTGDTPKFLFSPGWPEMYQNNLECSWVIRSPSSIVEFNLLFLEMEDEVACLHDSLVIRDGSAFVK